MTEAHRSHLCAGLSSLEEVVRDIAEIGRDGRSPTNGQRLTPLTPDQWADIEVPLHRAVARITEAVRRLAPEALAEREQAEGPAGTHFRLAILLRHAEEEIVDSLDPARMERKYGPLDPDERAAIADIRGGLRADLAEVRRLLQRARP